MNYYIKASSTLNQDAVFYIRQTNIDVGTTSKTAETLADPVELFLGSFASCILKYVERFLSTISMIKNV